MVRAAHLAATSAVCLTVLGCASLQLNYNTLDIASTIDSLIAKQVLQNLAKFIDAPDAIPSQVALSSGTVTTNNSITPSINGPFNAAQTATTTVASAATKTFTNTSTNTVPNVGFSLNAVDQWTQTWGISPLTDTDQLRRLRAIYQFGAHPLEGRNDFLCTYPLVPKKSDTGGTGDGSAGTVTFQDSGGKPVTVTIGKPSGTETPKEIFVRPCGARGAEKLVQPAPDPAFLVPPSCVICRGRSILSDDKKTLTTELQVNPRLTNDWLNCTTGIVPGGVYAVLGTFDGKTFYVTSPQAYEQFVEFSLFVLEASTVSAPSVTGQKGAQTKAPAFLLGPAGAIPLE